MTSKRRNLAVSALVSALAAFMAVDPAAAETKTFVGAPGASWLADASWSPSGVPQSGDAVVISGGTVDLPSATAIAALDMSGGALTGSGQLTVSGAITWSGGVLGSGGVLEAQNGIGLSGTLTLDGRTLRITSGTATLGGATSSVTMQNGAVFDNQATLDISDDGGSTGTQGFFGTGTISNAGVLRKSGGTGVTFIQVALDGMGSVEIASGGLRLAAESIGGGSYGVAAGAALEFDSGAHEIDAGGSIGGAGTARFLGGTTTVSGAYHVTGATEVSGGAVSLVGTVDSLGALAVSAGSMELSSTTGSVGITALDLSGGQLSGADTLTVNGLFTWTGGELQGTGSSNAVLNAAAGLMLGDGGSKRLNARTLNLNGGSGTMAGAATSVQMIANAIFNNQAVFELSDDGGGDQQGFFASGATSGFFNNHGILRKLATGNSGTTRFDQVGFTNTGGVELLAGTLRCAAGYTQSMGLTRLNGGNLEVTPALDLQDGRLEGSGTVNGNLINGGVVQPGTSPGVLAVTGSYTQSAAGKLIVEIAGTAPAQFDRLDVGGAATLGGVLDIRLIDSFIPALGDAFAIIAYASHTGSFAQVLGLDIGLDRMFSVVVDSTGIGLDVVPQGLPTATASATASPSPPASSTPTATASTTGSATATNTAVPSATATSSPSATAVATATTTPPATATSSPSTTATPESTATASPTATGASTPTDTPSAPPSATPSATASATVPTETPSASPTDTEAVPTSTATFTPIGATATVTDTVAPSPTATDTGAPTATLTPEATATATPTAGSVDVTIIVGDAAGSPGSTVPFDVTLQTSVQVAGTRNDIIVAPPLQIARREGGSPRCSVNSDISEDSGSFTLECTEGNVCTLHALVLASSAPFPNGATLYTCDVTIAAEAQISQSYPLGCANPDSRDADNNRLPTGCLDGSVEVVETVPTPSASPTATETPLPPATPTPPSTPTATGTAPFIVTHTGCEITASRGADLAWMLPAPLLLLVLRRRRPARRP